MTAHLTNEHSQLYSAVSDETDPPHRIINNISIPQGITKMYWICRDIFPFFYGTLNFAVLSFYFSLNLTVRPMRRTVSLMM